MNKKKNNYIYVPYIIETKPIIINTTVEEKIIIKSRYKIVKITKEK